MERAQLNLLSDHWKLTGTDYVVVDKRGKINFFKKSALPKQCWILGVRNNYHWTGFFRAVCRIFKFYKAPIKIGITDFNPAVFAKISPDWNDDRVMAYRVEFNDRAYDLIGEESISFSTLMSKRVQKPRGLVIKIYKPERTLRKFVIKF